MRFTDELDDVGHSGTGQLSDLDVGKPGMMHSYDGGAKLPVCLVLRGERQGLGDAEFAEFGAEYPVVDTDRLV